jgi:protein-L-isoaspartate(D-aspartate) O-methyltransferase
MDGRTVLLIASTLLAAIACAADERAASQAGDGAAGQAAAAAALDAPAERAARARMIAETIVARGVRDSLVLHAMHTVPRHLFVPEHLRSDAYADRPLPIGEDQTISQPYIVALMTELLALRQGDKVLEVGTGSGYQAAVLAVITPHVYSIEILPGLARSASERLARLGYATVQVRAGDGYRGWPEAAPFDAIIVTAAPDHVPEPLLAELAPGGRLVIPVGDFHQELMLITRDRDGRIVEKAVIPVRFVPMTGEAEKGR